MGEEQNRPFPLSFQASLQVGFQGSRLTSHGGLILVRELGERLSFGELIEPCLTDPRHACPSPTPCRSLSTGAWRGMNTLAHPE